MRRKTQNNGSYNNQHKKPRFSPGGSGGDHRSQGHHSGNRPRKNYGALREKYLSQARDALASGDRVLAENYYQHADHCYRMMVEEGSHIRQPQPVQQVADMAEGNAVHADESIQGNTEQLPAFLTANYEGEAQPKPVDPATIQNWEERDA